MESKGAVSQVFNNNPLELRLKGRPKNRLRNCVQADINIRKINNRSSERITKLSRVFVTIVAVGKQYYTFRLWARACASECLRVWVSEGVCLRACSLNYPACNGHAPHCHLWLLWLHHIFRHYLINDKIFWKVTEHKMCVLTFSTKLVWNISHSTPNNLRYWQQR